MVGFSEAIITNFHRDKRLSELYRGSHLKRSSMLLLRGFINKVLEG